MDSFWSNFLRHFAVLGALILVALFVAVACGIGWGSPEMGGFIGAALIAWIVYLSFEYLA